MPELASVNGEIFPIQAAVVPVEDRGYQFADAVYEYVISYNGRLFALEDHLERLMRSLQALDFEPVDMDTLRDSILTVFQQSGFERAGLYLQISRGVCPRNHLFPTDVSPQVIITVRRAPVLPEELRRQGIKAITIDDIRWKRCDIKTVQLLPNALAKQKAADHGADDAIFVSAGHLVREGTSSNLFMRQGDMLITPPLDNRILPGITRNYLIAICRDQGIPCREEAFDRTALLAADEVFLCGTVSEVLPVTSIDGRKIGAGHPGKLTRKLYELYLECAAAGQ